MNPELLGVAGIGISLLVYIVKKFVKRLTGRRTQVLVFALSLGLACALPHEGLEGLLISTGGIYTAALAASQIARKQP